MTPTGQSNLALLFRARSSQYADAVRWRQRQPDADADAGVESSCWVVTFAEQRHLVNQVISGLDALGARPGDAKGILSGTRWEWMVADWPIMGLGGVTTAPAEDQEELALIYQAKGVDEASARELARHLMLQDGSALDTLAREELGVDPQELGGSAAQAAVTSFCLFAAGALIPVLPYMMATGVGALITKLALSALGLFVIEVGITRTTGTPLLKAGDRQVFFGVAAATITFGLGRLVGGALG